jgi:hypothetical protein
MLSAIFKEQRALRFNYHVRFQLTLTIFNADLSQSPGYPIFLERTIPSAISKKISETA